MVCGFQGRERNVKKITYKDEGDGWDIDALCDEGGYTWTHRFRHDPQVPDVAPEMSPLHNRCLGMLALLPDRWYSVRYDNLFISEKVSSCKASVIMF